MSTPLLASRDPALIETVLAAAAPVKVEPVVARDIETLRRHWSSASVVLIGADQAATVAGLGLARRSGVHLCGPRADDLLAWSVPLDAPVMVLPDQTGFVASLLVGRDELSGGGATVLRVVGGSGGVGATTLAAGLAQRMAKRGGSVALVEMDALGGGLDIVFGAEQAPGWRWSDLASAAGHIGDLRGQLPNISGVDLLATSRPRSSSAGTELPRREAVRAAVSSLTRSHDLVVLDAGANPETDQQFHGTTVFVVAAEVKALVAARTRVVRLDLDDAVVAVRTGPGRRLDPQLVAETLGLRLGVVVPQHKRLPYALEVGEPPGLDRSRFTRACDQLLGQVLGDE